MPKPTSFHFLPDDPGIAAVAWWGERLMAFMWLVLTVSILVSTQVDEILDTPYWLKVAVNIAAGAYAAILAVIIFRPSNDLHVAAIGLGVMLYASRAAAFVLLWADGVASFNNIVERLALTASTIVYHTWGIWADRRKK